MPTKRLLILSMALIGAIIATTSFTTPPFPNPVVVSGTGDQSAWAAYRAGERAQLSASNFDPAS
jgi:uncharacterized membrane protein